MEQSKALHKLLEAADVLGMIEELFMLGTQGRLGTASLSGARVTLHGIRQEILASHDQLAAELVSKANLNETTIVTPPAPSKTLDSAGTEFEDAHYTPTSAAKRAESAPENDRVVMRRRDLRASIEKFIDR